MNNNPLQVTSIISCHVKKGRIDDYESWSKRINSKATEHDGFQNVTMIKPTNPNSLEYVVIVQWKDYVSLKNWQQSDDFKRLMKESEDFTVSIKTLQENAGMEIWFDLPNNLKSIMKPPFRKQVLVAIMVVLPLIFVVGKIMDPLLSDIPIIPELKIVIRC